MDCHLSGDFPPSMDLLYCAAADDDDDDDNDADAGERCLCGDGVNSNTLCTLVFFDILSHSTSLVTAQVSLHYTSSVCASKPGVSTCK